MKRAEILTLSPVQIYLDLMETMTTQARLPCAVPTWAGSRLAFSAIQRRRGPASYEEGVRRAGTGIGAVPAIVIHGSIAIRFISLRPERIEPGKSSDPQDPGIAPSNGSIQPPECFVLLSQ